MTGRLLNKENIIMRSLYVTVLIFLVLQTSCNDKTQKQVTGSESMFTFTLSSQQKQYVLGEDILVTATLINDGSSDINIPDFKEISSTDFYFELKDSKNNNSTFNFYEPVDLQEKIAANKYVTLASGLRYWGGANITRVANIEEEGHYNLVAIINIDGRTYTSKSLEFYIVKSNMKLLSLATGLLTNKVVSNGELAFVQQDAQGQKIYTAQFNESHHVGEVDIAPPFFLYEETSEIKQIWVPENNATQLGEMSRWYVWHNAHTVSAFLDSEAKALTWQAPEAIGSIAHAPYKVTGGPLEILVVSEDQNTLWLLHAEGGIGQSQNTLSLKWTKKINPGFSIALSSMSALDGSQTKLIKRHLVLIYESIESYSIHTATFDEQDLYQFIQHKVDQKLIRQVIPSVKTNEKGDLVIAALAEEQEEKINIIESQLSIDNQKIFSNGQVINKLQAVKDIQQGRLLYSKQGAQTNRLDLVVQRENGELIKRVGNTMESVSVSGDLMGSIELFSASNTTYIMYHDETDGFYFEEI